MQYEIYHLLFIFRIWNKYIFLELKVLNLTYFFNTKINNWLSDLLISFRFYPYYVIIKIEGSLFNQSICGLIGKLIFHPFNQFIRKDSIQSSIMFLCISQRSFIPRSTLLEFGYLLSKTFLCQETEFRFCLFRVILFELCLWIFYFQIICLYS